MGYRAVNSLLMQTRELKTRWRGLFPPLEKAARIFVLLARWTPGLNDHSPAVCLRRQT